MLLFESHNVFVAPIKNNSGNVLKINYYVSQ